MASRFVILLLTVLPLFAQTGRVRIRVDDPTGTVISEAQALLLAPDDKPLRTEHTNQDGEILFTNLPAGELSFEVRSPGFATRRVTASVNGSDESEVEVRLMVGTGGGPSSVIQTPATQTPASPPLPPKRHHRWIFR